MLADAAHRTVTSGTEVRVTNRSRMCTLAVVIAVAGVAAVLGVSFAHPQNPTFSAQNNSVTPPPNLSLWLSADCITLSAGVCGVPATTGTPISSWADRSPRADNGSVSGTCTFSTSQINGEPAVTFDGTSCGITLSTGYLYYAGFTVFVVAKNASTSYALPGVLLGGNVDAFNYWSCYTLGSSPPPPFYEQGAGIHEAETNSGNGAALCDTNWHQMNVRMYSSLPTRSFFSFRVDRAADGVQSNVSLYPAGRVSSVGFQTSGSAEYFNGQLAEIMVYRYVLSPFQVQYVEGLLHSKYGL